MASANRAMILPGPTLKERIDRTAAMLSKQDSERSRITMQQLLEGQHAASFSFFVPTSPFFGYFTSKLVEYRQDAAAAAAVTAKQPKSENERPSDMANEGERDQALQRKRQREAALEEAAREAKYYRKDPLPPQYSIQLDPGVDSLSSFTLDLMLLTAQYVARFGDDFLDQLRAKYRDAHWSGFLRDDGARHGTFATLVNSYKRILNSNLDEQEARLKSLLEHSRVLYLCEEKAKFFRAELSRKKAMLLSEEQLRQRLQWSRFVISHAFTLKELGLEDESN